MVGVINDPRPSATLAVSVCAKLVSYLTAANAESQIEVRSVYGIITSAERMRSESTVFEITTPSPSRYDPL